MWTEHLYEIKRQVTMRASKSTKTIEYKVWELVTSVLFWWSFFARWKCCWSFEAEKGWPSRQLLWLEQVVGRHSYLFKTGCLKSPLTATTCVEDLTLLKINENFHCSRLGLRGKIGRVCHRFSSSSSDRDRRCFPTLGLLPWLALTVRRSPQELIPGRRLKKTSKLPYPYALASKESPGLITLV